MTWAAAPPPPRVAYAIGRRVGSAVDRNRVRRRLRAAVAAESAQVVPGAYLISASPAAATLPFPSLRTAVRDAMHAAATRS